VRPNETKNDLCFQLAGVAHGDDLQYVFSDLWGAELPMSAADLKFSKNVFVPLLANFAQTRCSSFAYQVLFFFLSRLCGPLRTIFKIGSNVTEVMTS
jgi:Carboxylesterase family